MVTNGFLLVSSAHAGSTEDDAVEAARAVLAEAGPTELVTTGTPEELDAALLAADGRRVVVAGGDGSLHLDGRPGCGRLGRLDLPLALVPARHRQRPRPRARPPARPGRRRPPRPRTSPPRPLDLLVDDAGGVVVNAVHVGVGRGGRGRREAG